MCSSINQLALAFRLRHRVLCFNQQLTSVCTCSKVGVAPKFSATLCAPYLLAPPVLKLVYSPELVLVSCDTPMLQLNSYRMVECRRICNRNMPMLNTDHDGIPFYKARQSLVLFFFSLAYLLNLCVGAGYGHRS